MTKRSIIIGIALAVLLASVTFFNDFVMRGTYLVGHFLPVAVFGTLVLFLLMLNPFLARISDRLALSGRELAVIVALVLFVCYLPGRGLMHFFTTALMLPHHFERTSPGWQSEMPTLQYRHVQDWQALLQELNREAEEPALAALQHELITGAGTLPAYDGYTDETVRLDLLNMLNRVIEHSPLGLLAGVTDGQSLPDHARTLQARDPHLLSPVERQRINRAVLDHLFRGAITPQRLGVIDRAPARMLPDVSTDTSRVLDGFVSGLAQGDDKLSYADVPWRAWIRPLLFWMPLILTVCMMVVGLALVLHRQWVSHEHLPYPTVEFARSLLSTDDKGWSPTMRSRLFWLGALAVLIIHMNNYACQWWPDVLIPIKTQLQLAPLVKLFPVIERGGAWGFTNPTIFFTALGFAYFLATDVSLSLGLAPFLYCLIVGILAGYGVSVGGGMLRPSLDASFYAGSYFGMFVVLIYIGRHYYASAVRSAFGLQALDRIEGAAVWGVRIFLLMVLAFLFQLHLVGVDWQLSVLYLIGMLVIFTVISRLLAEAGVFFVHAWFSPCAVIWAFMGARAAGANQLLVLAMISGILLIVPREAMMPFVMSGMRLVDHMNVKIGKTALWGVVALVLAFFVAVPVVLHIQYERGAQLVGDTWTAVMVPKFPYSVNVDMVRRLEAQGTLDESLNASGWERFTHMDVDRTFLIGFACMFALVILFSLLRHRFARWPVHPLIFLVLGTYHSRMLAFSFLLGYFVKSAVTRYGGASLYRKLKPLMIGLIAGELLASVITVLIGAIYYGVKGEPPVPFNLLP